AVGAGGCDVEPRIEPGAPAMCVDGADCGMYYDLLVLTGEDPDKLRPGLCHQCRAAYFADSSLGLCRDCERDRLIRQLIDDPADEIARRSLASLVADGTKARAPSLGNVDAPVETKRALRA